MLTQLRKLRRCLLKHLCTWFCKCPKSGTAKWSLTIGRLQVSGEGFRMATTIPQDFDGDIVAGVAYVDSKGSPAAVDGFPTWTSSNEAVFTVQADADNPFQAKITIQGRGMAQLKAVSDVDLGEGTEELTTLGDIEIVSGKAVAGTFQISMTPKAPPAPLEP